MTSTCCQFMPNFNVYAARMISKEEPFTPGHKACQGCCEALAVRLVMKAIGRDVVVSNATGCLEIISSNYPDTAWEVPWIHTLFENTAAVASGVESAIKVLKRLGKFPKDVRAKVVAMAGDGGTADIGFQALSGAMERGHNMVYICYDNEAYMNTGIQRSSSTPYGATTTTSPAGRASKGQKTWKKNLPRIMAAHGIPYVATASPSYPFDLMDKVRKAISINGPAYIHVYASCPTGWKMIPDLAVTVGRLAVETGVFPLYEVENGNYKLNVKPAKLLPVKDYFSIQGRFRHLTDADIAVIQEEVLGHYNRLLAFCDMSSCASKEKTNEKKQTRSKK